ncbi:MAG: GFA family protein [Pseudomonadota bacterium]
MAQDTAGRCLCGATSWAFSGSPIWSCYCHCDDCRRNCAAPVVGWIGVPLEAFRWTGAAPRTYQSSPAGRRHFCARCGSPLGFEADHYAGDMHLYAASLDEPADFTPEFHVFWEAKLPWLPLADDLPKYSRSLDDAPSELRQR